MHKRLLVGSKGVREQMRGRGGCQRVNDKAGEMVDKRVYERMCEKVRVWRLYVSMCGKAYVSEGV